MKLIDIVSFAARALLRYRLRSSLILIAMAIGVAAVVVLTSLGEAARRYVVGEFASLGTHLVIVLPGRSETTGGAIPNLFMGDTPRDLTIDDALALYRDRNIRRISPIVIGAATANWGGRDREVTVLGGSSELLAIRHWRLAQGRFLPGGDPRVASAVAVIGNKVRRELFANHPALGQWLRLGDRRFRIVGVLASEGRSIGIDVEDLVIVPTAAAQALFNAPSLFRIIIEARSRDLIPAVKRQVLTTLRNRHQGEEDVTVVTQDAVLATFDRVFGALTLTVAGIAAISLAVAGILIMNIMLVAVTQRTAEVGLLKALGAAHGDIVGLFLAEATLLSAAGAGLGMALGQTGSWILTRLYPTLPFGAPWWAFAAGTAVALGTGMLFGALPARRAARLDPVLALARR